MDIQDKTKEELIITLRELLQENNSLKAQKEKRVAKLKTANVALGFQNEEKRKRAAELIIANVELAFQKKEKEKRADELIIANKELTFQEGEKGKRAEELIAAKIKIVLQSKEKEKLAAELIIANLALVLQEELIEAKEKVEENEIKFRNFFEHSLIAKSIREMDGTLEVNQAFCNVLGYSKKELEAKKWEEITYPEDIALTNKNIQLILKGTVPHAIFEKRYVHKNGSIIWADVLTFLQRDNDHKPKYFISSIVDTTLYKQALSELITANKELLFQNKEKEKRAAELIIANKELLFQNKEKEKRAAELIIAKEKAERNEKQFRTIFEQSPLGIALIDSYTGEFKEVNAIYASIVGRTTKEMKRINWMSISHQDDVQEDLDHMKLLVEGKISGYHMEKRYTLPNGEYVWVNLTVAPVNDVESSNPYHLAMVEDITKRKFAETELIEAKERTEESEKKFRLIMENSADAIFIIDENGKYSYTNKAVTTLLGFTKEEMRRKTIIDLSPKNRVNEYLEILNKIMTYGKIFTEIELLKNDGNFIFTDLNAVKLPNGMVYASCRDITERKQSEVELIEAKEHAEESDRLKTAFLANMSHEIRTPMNAILGFSDLLKTPNLSGEKQQKYLRVIERSGVRMLNIISDIISISKIESGAIEVNLQTSNINEQIEYIDTFFKPEAEAKGIALSFNNGLSLKKANVKTDSEKLYAILKNLVKNAIKYSQKGSVEFGYKLKKDREPVEVEFYVKDTGIGIDKDRQEAIFERFIQADISDKNASQGAGLGLTISKAYVEMLGGKIWLESEKGKGTTFYFTLPYAIETKEESSIDNTDSGSETPLKKLKILIVDDEELARYLFGEMLENLDKEILYAENGLEAVEICRKNHNIDLVLMDMRMPVMDGYEATRQIRQFNKKSFIIAQTAYALEGDREKAKEAGCNEYLSKPISRNKLFSLLKEYFDN